MEKLFNVNTTNEKEFFAARHSISTKEKNKQFESKKYHGIIEDGVELSKEKAKEILEFLKEAKEGTIIFLGGATEKIRTKSTARVFGDEAKHIIAKEKIDDIMVLTEEDIIYKETGKGYSQIVNNVVKKIQDNKDKKIILDFPLFLKEFGFARWTDGKGSRSDYTKTLIAKYGGNYDDCVKDWIKNKGKLNDLQGPSPTEVAEEHLHGINRLHNFIEKYINDRSIVVGFVGHCWNLDALAVYLANNKKVDLEGWQKIRETVINESELMRLEINKTTKFIYRNKEYLINTLNKSAE
ncbi:hypothetical protein KAS41_00060 [Candidatus Parcubacteria bacterium]|nr:hypothetical protein [Candidatus Parcubacteria bacterium]